MPHQPIASPTDQADDYDGSYGVIIADAIKIEQTANPPGATQAEIHYIHSDHLNTPQRMTNTAQQTVWAADYQPFGEASITTVSITNPLRFPGQYYDKETGLHHNGFRDFDPGSGRYIQSDPIGLAGGINTYGYALQSPIKYFDPDGLEVRVMCRPLAGAASYTGKEHCFVRVTCPEEGWANTYSLFSTGSNFFGWPNQGAKAQDDPRDDPNSPNNTSNNRVDINVCPAQTCGFEKSVRDRYNSFPLGNVPYSPFGPNSNSFAADLATGTPFGGQLPPGTPGPDVAPGINQPHPNFPGRP